MYKHDVKCLSETYLDSATPHSLLEIDGYILVLADHPDYVKRGGVGIYYKVPFSDRVKSLPYLKEALLLEMTYNNKKVIVPVSFRSPSQNNSESDLFLSNFENFLSDINQCKPLLSLTTGDFNARTSSWWSKGIDATEG